ncbi:LemA family protein [Candidatus Poribacteria bacterium]|nr:LemA family protein [Candidatus Poribacteria bacterium]
MKNLQGEIWVRFIGLGLLMTVLLAFVIWGVAEWGSGRHIFGGMNDFIAFVLSIVVVVFIGLADSYNKLVKKREPVLAQLGQLQNTLQRRADLIPNLVEVVKGYATHEGNTLERVIRVRANVTRPQINVADTNAFSEVLADQHQLTSSIGRLMVIAEQYPKLKASGIFKGLSEELARVEHDISTEQKRYNDLAREYNTEIQQLHFMVIAPILGFTPMRYFEAATQAQQVPKVSL